MAACAALLAIAAGCSEAPAPKAEAPRPVRVMTVAPVDAADALELPGEIRPRYETRYGFRVPGKIASRAVVLGQEVRTGQELARLDPQDAMPAIDAQTAQLKAARTEVALQQAELRRVKELRDRNFVSQAQVDRQQAGFDAAVSRANAAAAQLQQARNALDFSVLSADQPGVVTGIDAEAGQVVAAGQSVVRVAQAGEIEVVVNVPEKEVERFRRAKTLAVRAAALPGRAWRGTLRELSPLADPATRTFLARVTIRNPDEALKLGMSASLSASTGGEAAIVVPLSALRATDDQASVWLYDAADGSVRPVPVKLGATTERGVVIESGLKPGDVVVTAGATLLIPGQKVRLADAG